MDITTEEAKAYFAAFNARAAAQTVRHGEAGRRASQEELDRLQAAVTETLEAWREAESPTTDGNVLLKRANDRVLRAMTARDHAVEAYAAANAARAKAPQSPELTVGEDAARKALEEADAALKLALDKETSIKTNPHYFSQWEHHQQRSA